MLIFERQHFLLILLKEKKQKTIIKLVDVTQDWAVGWSFVGNLLTISKWGELRYMSTKNTWASPKLPPRSYLRKLLARAKEGGEGVVGVNIFFHQHRGWIFSQPIPGHPSTHQPTAQHQLKIYLKVLSPCLTSHLIILHRTNLSHLVFDQNSLHFLTFIGSDWDSMCWLCPCLSGTSSMVAIHQWYRV